MGHDFQQLKRTVASFSENPTAHWKALCAEWRPYRIERFPLDYGFQCECGVHIANIHYIKNIYNSNKLKIGSECIRHFGSGIVSQKVIEDVFFHQRFHAGIIKHALELNPRLLNEWERNFMNDVVKSKSFSQKTLAGFSEKKLNKYRELKSRVRRALGKEYCSSTLGNFTDTNL